ncbi:G-protein coupled receptor Mth2-like [Haliotis rubra]|uniref:G-protein coupled receptor Mth2-like n=1 Tax=Haliotis rubra TaxID=36100 RepID=UPI001EE5259D|nr:G-protein coupled receptor Mth2-like [Haliotis rubra]
MGCACDQYCGIVEDCCMDYNSTSDEDEAATLSGMKSHFQCIEDSAVANEDGFLAVASCPQSWFGSETEELCKFENVSDLMLRLPVTGNRTGLVYRNLYCAVCHDEPYQTLRNIPGKIILSLTTSLFFANLTVLFAPRAESLPTLCKVMAALMHYLFLDAFLWMNVMAADVWFTFSKSFVKAGDGGKSSKRFLFYNVYVRGVALVLVTAAVTVDNVVSESQFKPNYGRGLCWITNKRGLLVFFASPLLLLICLNFVFFSIAAKNIHDAKRKSAAYLGKGDSNQFGIYVKLSVIMGLTWVLGFLASLFPYTVMWYIYIIFNTLQGMFICIAFVFTKRVWHSLWERFINLRRQSASSGQMPSTPTRSTVLTFRVTDRVQ